MPPERSNLVLTSYIPHGERYVLVFYCLDIESCENESRAGKKSPNEQTDRWLLKLVQNRRFTSRIQADH
jgi:hypothetical protein